MPFPFPSPGPAPDPQGAARLRGLNSPANMSQFGDILAGLHAGDQTAGDFARSDALSDDATNAIDGGPALRGLRAVMDEHRLQHTQDEIGDVADLESGRPRQLATGEAGLTNDVEDINSERGFGRQSLPFALNANDRASATKSALANLQYVLPAQLKAQGDVAAAHETAQGGVNTQRAKDASLPMKGLLDAITAFISKNGKIPTSDDLASLQGVIK